MDCGEVHRFVRIADAGCAVAEVHDCQRILAAHTQRQRGAHGLRKLRRHHIGQVHKPKFGIRSVRGKLARAAQRFAVLGGKAQHNFARRHSKRQHHSKIAIVDVEQIRPATEGVCAANLRRLVSLRRRHDCRLALTVQHPNALVQSARQRHLGVHFQQRIVAQTAAVCRISHSIAPKASLALAFPTSIASASVFIISNRAVSSKAVLPLHRRVAIAGPHRAPMLPRRLRKRRGRVRTFAGAGRRRSRLWMLSGSAVRR